MTPKTKVEAVQSFNQTNKKNDIDGNDYNSHRTAVQSLNEDDYRKFAASFIDRETVEASGIYRVDSPTGAAIVGQESKLSKEDFSGIVIPYYLPEKKEQRLLRLRRDNPPLEEKADGSRKEIGKYLTPFGSKNLLYFPPNSLDVWLKDSSLPIVITEGEKKTLALARAAWNGLGDSAEQPKFFAVGIQGVWNFTGNIGKSKNGNGKIVSVKGMIPDLRLVEWQKRRVTILFDSNTATNDQVARARRAVAKVLRDLGAKVFFADLPEFDDCNGVDDALGKIEREQDTKAACRFLSGLLDEASEKDSTVKQKTNFEVREDGVFWFDSEGNETRICSKLEIVAETRDAVNKNWGRLLSFKDRDGFVHRWSMPMSLLSGSGDEYRKELLSHGLEINPSFKAKNLLTNYIQTFDVIDKLRCVSRIGWFNKTFVFPSDVIGSENASEKVIFQSENFLENPYQTNGTLEQWQQNVSMLAAGNSRLLFVISAAFAACLLPLLEEQGSGFHFRGSSSLGKTTALLVAGSVWGGNSDKGFIETWRSTGNAIEGVAELHNHALLCLDELKECDPKTIGQTAYMLVNGKGKLRMGRNASLRKTLEWNLIYLSSGEVGLSDLLEAAGERSYGGQHVRMIDFDADADAGLGLFEELHGYASANAFADALRNNSRRFYGAAIREFLSLIINCIDELKIAWKNFRQEFLNEYLPENAAGEIQRVAAKFALVAFAGETGNNIACWSKGEATRAAAKMFQSWLAARDGSSSTDADNAIRQVRHFLETHGSSRFQYLSHTSDSSTSAIISNRAGFKRLNTTSEQTEFLILPEIFRREVCKNFDWKTVAAELKTRGFLNCDSGKTQKTVRLPEMGSRKVYVVNSNIFEGEKFVEEKPDYDF